ncbi:MAG: hypothetical protein HY033_01415 [Ignavibacteriae bacterium]|nr:hypothetical protein [Ignavibacteria bacterium]MBI3363545.1 hypothetical protein [Ignavibacteriota bacterium]
MSQFCLSIILLGTVMFAGCHEGLAPASASPTVSSYGIRGVITFKNWPPADSVHDLRLGILQNYPVQDIPNEVLQGHARFTDRLPYGLDSVSYTLMLAPLPPGRFPFVGVAQQFGPNIQTDWRVVGIYYAGGDTTKPGAVDIPPDSVVPSININVDFQHLPPQP